MVTSEEGAWGWGSVLLFSIRLSALFYFIIIHKDTFDFSKRKNNLFLRKSLSFWEFGTITMFLFSHISLLWLLVNRMSCQGSIGCVFSVRVKGVRGRHSTIFLEAVENVHESSTFSQKVCYLKPWFKPSVMKLGKQPILLAHWQGNNCQVSHLS